MSGMRTAVVVLACMPTAYLLTGHVALLVVTIRSLRRTGEMPRVLRDAGGYAGRFRVAMDSAATWPWTWRKWTDG